MEKLLYPIQLIGATIVWSVSFGSKTFLEAKAYTKTNTVVGLIAVALITLFILSEILH